MSGPIAEIPDATYDVLPDVAVERARQEQIGIDKAAKGVHWSSCADPDMPGGDDRRYVVLGEEFGEVANALLEHRGDEALRDELIQVAAVAVAWVEAIDRRAPARAYTASGSAHVPGAIDGDRAVVELALGLIETHGFRRGGLKPETGLGVAAALTMVASDQLSAVRAAALIREANGIAHLVDWELEPERTQDDVVAALKRVAYPGAAR